MKTKNTILIAFFTLFILKNCSAQVKVFSNNKVQIGPLWWTTPPSEQLFINGGTHFNCFPSTSGLSLNNYNNVYLGVTYNEPVILPQWANSAWLGTPNRQFFRVYTNKIFVNQIEVPSDSNLKTNIALISKDSAIAKILRINAYTYDYKLTNADSLDDAKKTMLIDENKNQIGLIAQELIGVVPQAVKLDEITGNYSVNYIMLIPLLIEGMKKQQEQVNLLRQEIEVLKSR